MHFSGNDVVYNGQWLDSKRHGQGKLIFDKAEKCFYEGMRMSAYLPVPVLDAFIAMHPIVGHVAVI